MLQLRESLGIHEIFAHHAIHSQAHPLFTFFSNECGLQHIYYPEAYGAIRRAAKRVFEDLPQTRSVQAPVVCLLASLG